MEIFLGNAPEEGAIHLDEKIVLPPERLKFWKVVMDKISQNKAAGQISEEQANTQRAEIIAYQEVLATIDPLTKLLNRRGFEDEVEKGIATAKRNSFCASLLFIDADDLKAINKLGHDKGDEFLKRISLAIRESIRKEDIGARWGGDEFAVFCLGSNLQGALLTAERILEKVRSGEIAGKKNSVSIGVGEIDLAREGELAEHLKIIDQALLESKKLGKNQIVTVKLNG